VREGQTVTQDQVVADSDNTGNSTGPHLHWETRTSSRGFQRDTAYDPGPYVREGYNEPAPDPSPGTPVPGPGSPSSGWVPTPGGIFVAAPVMTITGGDEAFTEARFSPAILIRN